jgi:hypothetical protein
MKIEIFNKIRIETDSKFDWERLKSLFISDLSLIYSQIMGNPPIVRQGMMEQFLNQLITKVMQIMHQSARYEK